MIVAQERSYHYSLPQEKRRPVRRSRRNNLLKWGKLALIGLVLLCFCTGILIAFYYAQMLATGYRIYKLEKDLAVLTQETEGLNENISRLSSLERVETVATTKLGMVKPDYRNVVLVKADLETKTLDQRTSRNGALAPASNVKGSELASTAPAEHAMAEEKSQSRRNWVIQAFTDMVAQLEQKMRPS